MRYPAVRLVTHDGTEKIIRHGTAGRAQRNAAMVSAIFPVAEFVWIDNPSFITRAWRRWRNHESK